MSTGTGGSLVVPFAVVITVAATLGALHLLLLAFDRDDRRNLHFAVLAGAFALVAFFDYWERIDREILLPVVGSIQRWAVSGLILAAVRFAFSLFSDRAPRRFWVYMATILVLLLLSIPRPDLFGLPAGLLGIVVTADALVAGLRAWRRLPGEAWIIALGASLFAVGGLAQMSLDLLGLSGQADLLSPYLWGGLALLLASSIYLARSYAATRHELEARLVEVQELSAQALAQEQAAREVEIERRLLESENERRGRELEEARSLQLNLLPQALPQIPGHDLSAKMVTATEVGGDYYDAAVGEQGAVWLAVGDAVGHGARAGSLVAVLKGLFAGVAAQPSPAAALEHFGVALRRMKLQRAHLALAVARLEEGSLEIASAGMPPVLLRRASGRVEELAASALPLGVPLEQRYSGRRLELAPGDLIVLLTDGLVELPGAAGSPQGYDRVRDVVGAVAVAEGEPLESWIDEVLARLMKESPPPDDVTLMALRRIRVE